MSLGRLINSSGRVIMSAFMKFSSSKCVVKHLSEGI